jgi:hemoglobin
MTRSLYEKIGGFGTVSNIVLNFYRKVLESDAIAPYFAAVDMPRLIDHQTQFVCALLGGPASFSDDQIRNVHRPAAISHEAFDRAVVLFENRSGRRIWSRPTSRPRSSCSRASVPSS